MKRPAQRHGIAALVLGVLFAAFILYAAWPRVSGTPIELKLLPIDPFDLVRGQYLTLNYEINTPPTSEEIPTGVTVWVELESANGIYHATKTYSKRPPKLPEVLIRGVHTSKGRVEYGIESIFIERGARLTQQMTDLTAYVKVLPDGRASVIELHKDGKPVEFEYHEGGFLER